MEIRQLEYVLAVAEQRSFTAAAALVHVAQPAVSAQIAALEREVGQRLFTRTPRGAIPTEAGTELVGHARAVLDRLTAAREALDGLTGLIRGHARVGVIRGAELGRLAALLGAFRREHPGIDLTVREGESTDLITDLATGALDVALVGLAGPAPAGVSTRTVLEATVGALVPDSHAWAGRRAVTLADLTRRQVVTLAPGTGVRAAFDAACRARGLHPSIAFEVGTVGAALELAREGLGVAVVPGEPGHRLAPDLHLLAIRPVVRSRLAIAWATATPGTGRPAARALVSAASAAYR